MTYKGDPIAETLDRVAELTRVPRLSRQLGQAQPVRSRVLPSVLLAAAVAGMMVQIAVPGWTGFWIVWAAWMAATFAFQQLGPLGQPRKLDEREAAELRHGHLVGLMWTFGVVVIGALVIAFGKLGAMIGLWALWAPESPMDWMTVTLFLLALEVTIAVIAARSAMPEPLEDGEE